MSFYFGGLLRQSLLAEKKREIQKALEEWVTENSFLHPGEQLHFSLTIEKLPMVVEKSKRPLSLARMSVAKFFTRQRLLEAGTPPKLATRLSRAIPNAAYYPLTFKPGTTEAILRITTMASFMENFPSEKELLEIRDVGVTCLPYILRALEPLRKQNLG